MLSIRPARMQDVGTINRIYNNAVVHGVASFDIRPKSIHEQRVWFNQHGSAYPILVAEHESAVIGWGALSRYSERCGYAHTAESSVYISDNHQRTGVGTQLKKALIQAGRDAGFHVILALIEESNQGSLKINRQLGFREVGTMRQVGRKSDAWLNVVIMELTL